MEELDPGTTVRLTPSHGEWVEKFGWGTVIDCQSFDVEGFPCYLYWIEWENFPRKLIPIAGERLVESDPEDWETIWA